MILLRDPQLLFIKTRKTAGTSVEIALSESAGGTDILTPISMPDELVRRAMGFGIAANWASSRRYERMYAACVEHLHTKSGEGRTVRVGVKSTLIGTYRARLSQFATRLRKWPRIARFQNHMPPSSIRAALGDDAFRSAHKITICRHPYEQIVSEAYWRVGNQDWSVVSATIDQLLERRKGNCGQYFDGSRMVIDTFLRFESLREDLQALENRFGLAIVKHIPVTKRVRTGERKSAACLLSREQRRKCVDVNRFEFDELGYEP